MHDADGRRRILVISACMRRYGTPDFALNEVEVSQDEYENGVHYDRAEERLFADGFEEPFVHFGDSEAPPFLIPAVRQYHGLPDIGPVPSNLVALEES